MNRNRYFCTIKKTHPVNIKSYGNLLKRCIENIGEYLLIPGLTTKECIPANVH